ncbi:unnamed protein product [Orchesella dallaii]|uniref:Uncharacterized protein n=1 Tax=Orchesella dallaii TaxID=48710 RepID=A0ABP1S709_9HEXA
MLANTNFYSTSPDALLMDMLRRRILAQNPALIPISTGIQVAAAAAGSSSHQRNMANSMPGPLLPSLIPPQKFFEKYVDKTPVRGKNYPPVQNQIPAVPLNNLPKPVGSIPQKIIKAPATKEQPCKTRNPIRPVIETFTEKDLEITRLRSEITKLQNEHEIQKQRVEKNLNALLAKNSQYCSTVKKNEQELQTLKVKLSKVLKQNHKISCDYEEVAREKNEFKQKVNDLVLEKSQLEIKYSLEISNMKSTFQHTKLENEGMHSGYNAQSRDLEAMKKLFSNTNSDLVSVTKQKKNLDKLLTERDNEIAELKGKLENMDHLLFTQVSTHQIETLEFHTKIKNLEENVGKLGTQLVMEKLQNKKLQQENSVLKTRKTELETRLEDHANVAEAIKISYQKENSKLKTENEKEIANLGKERDIKLQKFEGEITTLRAEMEELLHSKFDLNLKLKKRQMMGHPSLPEVSERIESRIKRIKRKFSNDTDFNEEINDVNKIPEKLIKSDCKSDKDSVPELQSKSSEEEENSESSTTSLLAQVEVITLSDEED